MSGPELIVHELIPHLPWMSKQGEGIILL